MGGYISHLNRPIFCSVLSDVFGMRTGNSLISEAIIVGQAYLPVELYKFTDVPPYVTDDPAYIQAD